MKRKILIIGIAVSICLVIVIVLAIILNNQEGTFRVIKVMSVEGIIKVTRTDVGELDAYEGMALQSGDTVHISGNSGMVLLLDDDKYSYIEENTIFTLMSEGNSKNNKTKIVMESGKITFDIQKKLNKNSSYEVNTPNSTMAVRGTNFEVIYENGKTVVNLFTGKLDIHLLNQDGSFGEQKTLESGFAIGVTGLETPAYDGEPQPIKDNHSSVTFDENGALQKDTAPGPFEVKFYNGTELFCTQTVNREDLIEVPSLQPEEKGSWDVDFTNPVTHDVDAFWVSE